MIDGHHLLAFAWLHLFCTLLLLLLPLCSAGRAPLCIRLPARMPTRLPCLPACLELCASLQLAGAPSPAFLRTELPGHDPPSDCPFTVFCVWPTSLPRSLPWLCRELPGCRHTFHADCLDPWLRSKPLCPVCRCLVEPSPKEQGAEEQGGSSEPR